MKYIVFVFLMISNISFAQSDKKIWKDIQENISFLANDKLEGRRTGTKGEELAYTFIEQQFKKNKLTLANGFSSYIQPFEVNEGLMLGTNNQLRFENKTFELNTDYVPMPYTANGNIEIKNWSESALLLDVNTLITANKDNPHFDLEEALYRQVKTVSETQTIRLMVLYNSADSVLQYTFDKKNKKSALSVAVLYCNKMTATAIQKNTSETNILKCNIEVSANVRTGHNVVGMIDNNAPLTVIVGAHYDHLGYGEDHNSLYGGKEKMIHNGADDNASGTAALLSLSKLLHKSKYKAFNYLFVAFSGEELGLYGSKYFTEHCPVDLKNVNYMINMDMVGRLNDSTHGITIGGYGTSPAWGKLIPVDDAYFKIKVDSAGSGPSDHTSFYRKDLPVLFFFTGTHSDYHKPSDDADKINIDGELKIIRYIESLIEKTTGIDKLTFSKTREAAAMGKSSFKVTLGIMPDYTFSGNGVLVEGVSDNRPAQKAGILAGDVIYQLGDHKVSDVQSYMQALNKFSKGESTVVKFLRNAISMEVNLTF